MPFGLSNSAATFQRFIYQVLRGMDFCVPYFDDVLVASEDEDQHLSHLRQVFQRFEEYGVVINASKCLLGETLVKFLGHLVTAEGISPLPEKVMAIANFLKPETVKELRRFLAICNFYRRFITHAARTQAVLNNYLKGAKKNDRTPILWAEESAAAFEKCKKDLAEATVLYHPSADASLAIVVDASDTAATTAEMIYGAPIRLPGEFLCPSKSSADPVTFVGRLREPMQRLSPPTIRHHGQPTIFVSKDLATCNHVFLRTDSLRKGLQPPYEGPYKVVDLTIKVFRIVRHGKEVSVSID
ncbi:retrovirus-related Pol polyprotein from transposon opus [Trichonephila clavata]|uniref:RNA-directed DNA polymerase n=1 Tax=Trichonephila clavata TaxID=2740835 RepID=A0A8X6HRZ2_TRICU|nr:retrovirus-related Pol polyprotein from transposon opus [Trichonephila clavata]